MSKKSHKTEPEPENPKPEKEVEIENLCDEKWSCDIIFVIECDVPSSNFINILQQFKQIQPGIKSLTKNEILKEVKKGAGKKTSAKSQKKGQEPVELTDEQKIMKAVKDNTQIPSEPLAKFIKKILMNFKTEDINERNKLFSEFLQTQKKKIKPQSKISKKGVKRDENSSDDKLAEGSFIERPPLFIIMTGFYEYDLPLELLKENIPIRAVIKLKDLRKVQSQDLQRFNLTGLESDKFTMNWLKFWYMYENLMDIPVNAQLGNDVALIVKYIPAKINDPTVNVKDKKSLVQNEILTITNYIRTLLQRHKNYLEVTQVYDIPAKILSLEEAPLYLTLTKMVPLECTSVQFVLFCIIEQVCFWNGEEVSLQDNYKRKGETTDDFTVKETPVIITNNDEDLLKTFHLEIPEINLKRITKAFLSTISLLKKFKTYPKKTFMEMCFYDHHLQRSWKMIKNKNVGLNLFYIYLHWYTLCKIKAYYLFKTKYKQINESSGDINNDKILFLTHNSDEFCAELINTWINEFIRYSILKIITDDEESIDPQKVSVSSHDPDYSKSDNDDDDEDEKKTESSWEARDVKKIKKARKDNLKNLRNFLYCLEILCLQENEKSPKIGNLFKDYHEYEYIEEMPTETMLQVLQTSLLNYCYVENLYYPPTNKILLWFHNDRGTVFEEKYSVELKTLLGFRDFYTYVVLPEELKAEETANQENTEPDGNEFDELLKQNITSNGEFLTKDQIHYNLGKTKKKFDCLKRKFISEDGTTVTVEIDHWYKSIKDLKISVDKIDTELKIYKQILEDDSYETDTRLPDENFTAVLTLPNGTLLHIPTEEKNICATIDSNVIAREFIYNSFSITLPNGLLIEVIKNNLDKSDTYIKQSYISKGPDCNKIWDEKWRCFLKSGTIIIHKNDGTFDIIYNNMVKSNVKSIAEVKETEETYMLPVIEIPVSVDTKKDKLSSKDKKKLKDNIQSQEIPEVKEEDVTLELPYEVTDHSVTSWSGYKYEFKDNFCTNVIDNDVNLRTIFSPYKQLFVDRNDGVKCLLNSDGSLVSMFSDGTKLTTYFFEEEISICLSDYVTKYSSMTSIRLHESGMVDLLDSRTEQIHSNYNLGGFQMTDDSFESVKLGCVMEHPNYARVEFAPEKNAIILTLPGDSRIEILENTKGESYNMKVTVGKNTKVLFFNDSIEFSSNIFRTARRKNVTIIKPHPVISVLEKYDPYFCKTIDSFGCIFLVEGDGEVKLKTDLEIGSRDILKRSIPSATEIKDSYFNDYIPKRIFSRFLVVNENYSGYEIINKNDKIFFDEYDEQRFDNVSVIKNPSNGIIDSEISQYLIHRTHSENYLMPYKSGSLLTIPDRFQRLHLGQKWTPLQSPWFLVRSEGMTRYFKRFSYSEIARHDDKKIIAVVIKTVQKVISENEFNGVEIISDSLKKCTNENEELIKKYKSQNFTDFEIDARLKETQELIFKIKNEFSNWNVIKKDCGTCKQKFGYLKGTDIETIDHDDTSESFEHIVNKFEY